MITQEEFEAAMEEWADDSTVKIHAAIIDPNTSNLIRGMCRVELAHRKFHLGEDIPDDWLND